MVCESCKILRLIVLPNEGLFMVSRVVYENFQFESIEINHSCIYIYCKNKPNCFVKVRTIINQQDRISNFSMVN